MADQGWGHAEGIGKGWQARSGGHSTGSVMAVTKA